LPIFNRQFPIWLPGNPAIGNWKWQIGNGSRLWLGLAKAGDLFAGFTLAALFEKRGTFEALEDIALAAQGGRRAETAML